jgi:hypothetical protein
MSVYVVVDTSILACKLTPKKTLKARDACLVTFRCTLKRKATVYTTPKKLDKTTKTPEKRKKPSSNHRFLSSQLLLTYTVTIPPSHPHPTALALTNEPNHKLLSPLSFFFFFFFFYLQNTLLSLFTIAPSRHNCSTPPRILQPTNLIKYPHIISCATSVWDAIAKQSSRAQLNLAQVSVYRTPPHLFGFDGLAMQRLHWIRWS